MEKKLTFNLEKLIWVQLCEQAESQRYVYYKGRPRKKFLWFTTQSEHLPQFIDKHEWRCDNEVSKEEILATGKYIITEDNKVITKPHLRLLLQGLDSCSEIFYDTLEEATSSYSYINAVLEPNVLRCNR